MVPNKMHELMNDQIKHELESYYLYLNMAAYFHDQNLDGMASWMRAQAHEEMIHAMKFFNHLVERGAKVILYPLSVLKATWENPLQVWKEAYDHELFISSKINSLVKVAKEIEDFTSMPLLHWFLEEQIEEEKQTQEVVALLERAGSSGMSLIYADQGLGHRKPGEGSALA
ncbi:MAG TPA: ferritin [Caldisericia bacterium]|nr:ferritin [Caldisericia bacterium]HOU07467.1 ferritin [Caldisericia bacterium]HPL89953.1 ferritin [Caldisericia bacterium]HQG59276.1 ferritin [Caldisericia bacterium]HQH48638.1 ferritin [Caldisericia bacterium]